MKKGWGKTNEQGLFFFVNLPQNFNFIIRYKVNKFTLFKLFTLLGKLLELHIYCKVAKRLYSSSIWIFN